jgi:hypothetical protein
MTRLQVAVGNSAQMHVSEGQADARNDGSFLSMIVWLSNVQPFHPCVPGPDVQQRPRLDVDVPADQGDDCRVPAINLREDLPNKVKDPLAPKNDPRLGRPF